MMFISVVVGLGTDYGTFFLFRYREERVLGRTFIGALERTAARSGPGILLGALTAAVTFYILMTAEFQGIRDFGFISGTAILLSFLSMVTVFPAAVLLIDRWQNTPLLVPVDGQPDAARPRERAAPAPARGTRDTVVLALRSPSRPGGRGPERRCGPRTRGRRLQPFESQANATDSVVWEECAAPRESVLRRCRRILVASSARSGVRALASVSDVQSGSRLPDNRAENLASSSSSHKWDSIPSVPVPRAPCAPVALETLKRRRLASAHAAVRAA